MILLCAVIPYILFGTRSNYYWCWYYPLFIMTIIKFLLCMHCLFVSTRTVMAALISGKRDANQLAVFWKAVQRNRRMISFLCFHVVISLVVMCVALDLYKFRAPKLKHDDEEYIKCLMQHSVDEPEAGGDACGEIPRPPFWEYVLLNYFKTFLGIVPLLIFGTSGGFRALWDKVSRAPDTIRSKYVPEISAFAAFAWRAFLLYVLTLELALFRCNRFTSDHDSQGRSARVNTLFSIGSMPSKSSLELPSKLGESTPQPQILQAESTPQVQVLQPELQDESARFQTVV